MTDIAKEYPADPRGGLFIDFGDGRGRIHESELTPSDRELAALPAIKIPEAELSASPTVRETDNG